TLDDVDESRRRTAERAHTPSPIHSLESRFPGRKPAVHRRPNLRVPEKRQRPGSKPPGAFDPISTNPSPPGREPFGPHRGGIPRGSEALQPRAARWIDGGDVLHRGAE